MSKEASYCQQPTFPDFKEDNGHIRKELDYYLLSNE